MSMCYLVVKTIDAMNTQVDLSPSWQVKFGSRKRIRRRKKGMALEEKGMALGKRGMARRHAKRGWGKHLILNQWKEKRKCVAGSGIKPRTSDS